MSKSSQTVSPSLRDYLEAIYIVKHKHGAVRAKYIADWMGVKRSSVTGALRSLSEKKLVNYSPYSVITMTQQGKVIAREEVRKFKSLKRFYEKVLSVPESDAEQSARMTKRNVPSGMLNRLAELVDFLESCPRGYFEWNKDHGFFCPPGKCDNEECGAFRALKRMEDDA